MTTTATIDHSADAQPPHNGRWLLALLALYGAMAPLSVDLYLPALPAIAAQFHADQSSVQLTLSSFLAGFGGGQLFWGPLGDRYGRRRPIMIGLALFIVASLGIVFASSVEQIIVWRFLQAVGGCSTAVLGSAMIRDLYEGAAAVKIRSQIQLVSSAAPLLAPVVGGQLLRFMPWEGIFVIVALVGIIGVFGISRTPETLPAQHRHAGRLRDLVLTYLHFFTDRHFFGYALSLGLIMGGLFAFITGSPFVYMNYYSIPARYFGLLFSLNVGGIILTGRINFLLSRRFGPRTMLRFSALWAAFWGIVCAVIGHTGWGGLWGLVAPIVAFISVIGIAGPNAMVGGLETYPHKAGSASALLGSMGTIVGSFSGALVSLLADGTPGPMTLVIGLMGVGALAVNLTLLRQRPIDAPATAG